LQAGLDRPLGKLGNRLGPPIFKSRQFSTKNKYWNFIKNNNETMLAYFLIIIQ